MSADIAIFHSSEVDDAELLREGWYVGAFCGDTLTAGNAVGPYATESRALQAMASGNYLRGSMNE